MRRWRRTDGEERGPPRRLLEELDEAEALLGRRRYVEARELLYGFAPISLARMHIQRGELDDARALLQPLLTRPRIHIEEFGDLCATQIDLALAEQDRDAARTWLDLWAGADPENPTLATWRRRIGASPARRLLGRRR